MMEVTLDKIINTLETWVKERHPIDAHTWLDAAQKMTLLLGDEHTNLFTIQQHIAKQKAELVNSGMTVAKANLLLEATDEYRAAREQEAKIKRVEELVRISKIQARLADREMALQ